jgi:hypothetical protein
MPRPSGADWSAVLLYTETCKSWYTLGMDMLLSTADNRAQHCTATRKQDGQPCRLPALADGSGRCFYHSELAQAGRVKGGYARSNGVRAVKRLPAQLAPVLSRLVTVFERLDTSGYDTKRATALASVASVIVRVVQAGELEMRMRQVEEAVAAGRGAAARDADELPPGWLQERSR